MEYRTARVTYGVCSITFLYHAIENTAANTNNPTYARRMMRRLGAILSKIQRLSSLAVFSVACSSNLAIQGRDKTYPMKRRPIKSCSGKRDVDDTLYDKHIEVKSYM